MRVGIDAQFLAYERRGVGNYIEHLVRGLIRASNGHEFVVYGPRKVFGDLAGEKNFVLHEVGRIPYPLWEQFVLPLWAHRDGLDLIHSPANTAPMLLSTRTRLVVTVHDVMFLLPSSILPRPKTLRQRLGKAYRRFVVPHSVSRADAIVAMSKFSKGQVVDWLGIDPRLVRVVYRGVVQDPEPRECCLKTSEQFLGRSLGEGFVLALGASDPRKNTEAVIRIYADLLRHEGISERLVVAGLQRRGSSEYHRLARDLGVSEHVLFAPYVPDNILISLFRASRCLLYPTLYEGFGLPPLEAMACGTPVIASGVTSMPEILGDAALLVDPTSHDSIKSALLRVLHDEKLRLELIQRGLARAAEFQWQRTVEQMLSIYLQVGASSRSNSLAVAD